MSDQLNNKQYQATLELLIKEKECLETKCNEQQIQINSVQSENEALKNQCANHQEAITNMGTIISCITEDNDYLKKEIERLNKENQCFKKENQCAKDEPDIARLNIQSSDDDSTEIRETASK